MRFGLIKFNFTCFLRRNGNPERLTGPQTTGLVNIGDKIDRQEPRKVRGVVCVGGEVEPYHKEVIIQEDQNTATRETRDKVAVEDQVYIHRMIEDTTKVIVET